MTTMPSDDVEVPVSGWRRWLMLAVALVVVVHSAVVALWLSPSGPLRESVVSTTLASYVNPYFRQSPESVDPGVQRADEALLVRARVLSESGEVVETPWVDLTDELGHVGLVQTRMHRAARALATNLNVVVASLPDEALPLLEVDLEDDGWAERQAALQTEGVTSTTSLNLLTNWTMATQFGTLYSAAVSEGIVEEVQVRVGLRRVPAFDDRRTVEIEDEDFAWTTFGWRAAIAGNEEAQRAFDDYVGADDGA